MSVQASTTHSSASHANKASSADGRHGRAKAAGAGTDDGAAGAGLGFMAILSSMDEVDTSQGTSLGLEDAQDSMVASTDATAPSALLAQSNPLTGLPAGSTLPGADAAQQGEVTAKDGTALGVAAVTDGKAAASRAGVLGASGKGPDAGVDSADSGLLTKDLQGKESTRGAGLKKQDKQVALPEQASAVAHAATQKQDAQDTRLLMAMEIHKAMQGSEQALQAVGTTLGREEQRSTDKSIFSSKPQDGVPAVTTNGLDPASSGPLDVPAPVTDVAAATDAQVAEQVQYWISNDVQNAELKLDGLGEKPVEVSISMQGNEAHVSFRTDEASARSALENAGTHLKDMLQREGLTLGGVFVGNSGGQGADREQQRQPRQGVRQAQVAAARLQPVDQGRRSHGMTGRALDLFV